MVGDGGGGRAVSGLQNSPGWRGAMAMAMEGMGRMQEAELGEGRIGVGCWCL